MVPKPTLGPPVLQPVGTVATVLQGNSFNPTSAQTAQKPALGAARQLFAPNTLQGHCSEPLPSGTIESHTCPPTSSSHHRPRSKVLGVAEKHLVCQLPATGSDPSPEEHGGVWASLRIKAAQGWLGPSCPLCPGSPDQPQRLTGHIAAGRRSHHFAGFYLAKGKGEGLPCHNANSTVTLRLDAVSVHPHVRKRCPGTKRNINGVRCQ